MTRETLKGSFFYIQREDKPVVREALRLAILEGRCVLTFEETEWVCIAHVATDLGTLAELDRALLSHRASRKDVA